MGTVPILRLNTANMIKKVIFISLAVAAFALPSGVQDKIDALKANAAQTRANIRAMAEECGVNEAVAKGYMAQLKEAPMANFSTVMAEVRSKNPCFTEKLDASGAAEKLNQIRNKLFAAYNRLSQKAVDIGEQSIADIISELKEILNNNA